MKPKIMLAVGLLIIIITLILFLWINQEQSPTIACETDAMICPDGSTVGRITPDCKFAPCPNCICPENFILDGNMCIPKCQIPQYPSAPVCLLPGVPCTKNSDDNQQVGVANPASVNYINQNGKLEIVNTNDGQIGICTLPNGKTCEEWALLRGECTP